MAFFTMAGTALKALFSKPATRLYPNDVRPFFDRTRGRLAIEFEKCIFCSMCQRRCPTGAITVDKNGKLWQVDHLRCISCGNCCEACPKKCLHLTRKYSASLVVRDKAMSLEVHRGA